jgi:hypothetical protein
VAQRHQEKIGDEAATLTAAAKELQQRYCGSGRALDRRTCGWAIGRGLELRT